MLIVEGIKLYFIVVVWSKYIKHNIVWSETLHLCGSE